MVRNNVWRLRAYQCYELLCSSMPDDDPGVLAEEAATQILPVLRSLGWHGTRSHLLRWLGNPDKYEPYLDEVALARAINFDWPVIRRLTADETTELYERLAQMDDPYDETPDGEWERFLRRYGHTRRPAGERKESTRHAAWASGGVLERQALSSGVVLARRRNALTAVAA
jgi:hypothetical protein